MSNATKNAPAMLILAIDTSITPHFYLGITTPAAQDGSATFPSGLRPDRHRKRRKTKTSSDASREAPERAWKDTPKEVKLHKGSYPSLASFR
jgi:hypothetical protein